MRNLLVKGWPSAYPNVGCCGLIAVVRWLVDCPGLVAVGKLLWVACCELVVTSESLFLLLWIVRCGSCLLLWVCSCDSVAVGWLSYRWVVARWASCHGLVAVGRSLWVGRLGSLAASRSL